MRQTNTQQETFFFMQEGDRSAKVKPPFDPKELARLAAEGVFFGTNSWKYRGWEGLIYVGDYASEAQFQRQSLREYTHYFPAVGADFTYYAWPTPDMISYLLESSPENFRFVFKATKRATLERFPDLPLYGKWAGKENPEFLNAELFNEQFITPILRLESRVGAVVFEFAVLENNFFPKLDEFFSQVNRALPFAVEVRRPEDLSTDFYRLLVRNKVTPVLQSSAGMPSLLTQWKNYQEAGGREAFETLVISGDVRPGRTAEEATRLFHPFREIQEPFEEGRAAICEVVLSTRQKRQKTFILLHNRWEGCAPKSVGELVQALQQKH